MLPGDSPMKSSFLTTKLEPTPTSTAARRDRAPRRWRPLLAVGLISAGTFCAYPPAAPPKVDIPATDPRLQYEGRWLTSGSTAAADWPCASMLFDVHAAAGDVALVWSGVRVRLNATIYAANGTLLAARTLVSSAILDRSQRDLLQLPANASHVRIRKLTEAEPYQDGFASWALAPSKATVYGLDLVGGVTLGATPLPTRRLEVIGASDTAGYCVDGLNTTSAVGWSVGGWQYSNCDQTVSGLLGRRLDASVSVQAQPSMGLVQNAMAKTPYVVGNTPMPVLFNRTLMSDKSTAWPIGRWVPDAVLISLGGNDYNHQKGYAPSNATFTAAYGKFLDHLFEGYAANPNLVVVSFCGQGSPVEHAQDPDNDRCRPCPHVSDASDAYAKANPTRAQRVHYVFVPCDGSVVTGDGDIGCNGHKNRLGQAKVADFLEPKLRAILGW